MTVDLSIYLVTDGGLAATRGRSVAETVKQAVDGGVTAVQIREKNATARQFLSTVIAVADLLPHDVALMVNDRVDVFLAARAAGARVTGIHLGQDDLPVRLARKLIGEDAVIGLSAATGEELADASVDPGRVDYVGVGALRPTTTKRDAPPALGIAGFARLTEACELPAVAIGGVRTSDMAELRASGAAGAAIVSAICAALDPTEAARGFCSAWRAGA